MQDNLDIKEELDELMNLRLLVQVYEEVAASGMQRIRAAVLQKRSFVDELQETYQILNEIYKQEIESLLKEKNVGNAFLLGNKNGKTLALYMSSNTGLYGDIVQKTFSLFSHDIKEHPEYDLAIVGKLGKRFAEEIHLQRPFTYFDIPDQQYVKSEVTSILHFLLSYEAVIVYHGLFRSVVTQDAVATKLTATEKEQTGEKKTASKWIIDPTLENILEFFETEFASSFFLQTLDESQLAKLASRITALENATDNIKKSLAQATEQQIRVMHAVQNRKQLDLLAGMSLWDVK